MRPGAATSASGRSIWRPAGFAPAKSRCLPPSAGNPPAADLRLTADPTVYARVDYLDPNAKLTKEEKSSCQAILQDLPVVFTFAPMNLLYYQAKFPAHGTRLVTVSYRQYAFADTRGTGSYQLAYVLHPATLWKDFGPIHLTLSVPEGVACRASAAVEPAGANAEEASSNVADRDLDRSVPHRQTTAIKYRAKTYRTTLDKPEQKQGELFVAVDKAAWDKAFRPAKPKPALEQRPHEPDEPTLTPLAASHVGEGDGGGCRKKARRMEIRLPTTSSVPLALANGYEAKGTYL